MKTKLLVLLLVFSACAFAQSAPALSQIPAGFTAPDAGRCADTANVGSTYNRLGNPANAYVGVYLCVQTGASSYAWQAVPTQTTQGFFCGATSGSTTCANTSTTTSGRVIGGIATLAANTAVISGISPVFTSTTSFTCVANDITTRANPVQVANTSTSSITITNTTGATDVISWICVGS